MIHFRVLGALELRRSDGKELRSVIAQPKRLALFAYLAVASPRGFHRRDTLLGLFWPDLDEERARGALSQALYYLRRALGRDVVMRRGAQEVGVDARRIWCDAVAFEEALEAGAAPDALSLYRGDLLPGFFLSGALEWERWLETERSRLRARAAAAAWTLAEAAAADSNAADAGHWGRRAVALAPGDESQLRRLITLLDRVGDWSGALGAYEQAAERLARDYEIEPSPETRALIEGIRSRAEASAEKVERSGPADEPSPVPSPALADSEAGPPPSAHAKARATSAASSRAPVRRLLALLRIGAVAVPVLAAAALLGSHTRDTVAVSGPAEEAALLRRDRLAVLPLVGSGSKAEDAHLADALTHELISLLSEQAGVLVIAGTSVMRYSGTDKDVAEIGRELGVGTLLAGSVRMTGESGGRLLISVELIDADNREHLWAKDYEANLVDVPAVQRDIAKQVATAMRLPARGREGHRLGRETRNVDAYAEYLQGRYFLGKLDAGSFGKARGHFQRSLDLDPTFARAWAGLADAYNYLTGFMVLPANEAYPRARAAAERALELDPDLAEAHAALALALAMYYWDTGAAERHFRRAVVLDPNSARSHLLYSKHLRNLGRLEEALVEVRKAQELDPLNTSSHIDEGVVLYMAGRYDEAIERFRRFLRVAPDQTHAYIFIAKVHAENGRYEEALASLREMGPQPKRPDVLATRAYIYARMGRHAEARRLLAVLDELIAVGLASPFHKAAVYVGLGEHDRAVGLLEEAAGKPTWQMRLLKVEPLFRPLQSEPRFQALLRKLNLTD